MIKSLPTLQTLAIASSLTLLLSACGATSGKYEPVVDGHRGEIYYSDLADCQQLSTERKYVNDDTKSEALLGAAIGGLIGAVDEVDGEELEGAIAGAIVGAVLHGGSRAWETREERKHIILSCMQQRGHNVVG